MTYALWIVGFLALMLWGVTAFVAFSGDNSDANALAGFAAMFPAVLAIVASLTWAVLAAVHWL